MKLNMIYKWEIETADGTILNQYNEDGTENSSKTLVPELVVRISYIPCINLLPRHDCFFDLTKDVRFVRRFGRGICKQRTGFELADYLNCIVTTNYRLYILSSGRCLLTDKDFELYF